MHVGTPEPPCHGQHGGSPSSPVTVHPDIELPRVHATQVPTTEVSSGILGGVESGTIDRRDEGANPLHKSFVGSGGPYFHHPSAIMPMGASKLGRPPLPPLESSRFWRGDGFMKEDGIALRITAKNSVDFSAR